MYSKLRSAGFTLIELMVVLALVAVIAGVAIPNFKRLLEEHRVVSTTNSIVGLLNYARSEAVRRGGSVKVESKDNAMTVTLTADGSTLRVLEPPPGNTVVTDATVQFRASGMSDLVLGAPPVTFTICAGAAQGRDVSVARGGRVETVEVDC